MPVSGIYDFRGNDKKGHFLIKFYRQPTTSVPISFKDILAGSFSFNPRTRDIFAERLSKYLGKKYIFLTNKGTSAFFLILKVVSRGSEKKEVIVPAYTIPIVVQAIEHLGLVPRLVDIDLKTLNFDFNLLPKTVNSNTLAVIPVHLFGFIQPLGRLKELFAGKKISIIEDVCQCWGTVPASNEEIDAAFWSLCKGKNFSTFQGGVIGTNSENLAKEIEKEISSLPETSFTYNFKKKITMPLLAMAMHPAIYGMFYPIISRFKSTSIHADFPVFRYPAGLAPYGISLMKKLPEIARRRRQIGMKLYAAAANKKEIIVPEISQATLPGFNHLPVIFRDPSRRAQIEKQLWEKRIDTGRMYLKPVHMIFDLDYPKDPQLFPNAALVAEGLLTIPAHPYLKDCDIDNIIGVMETIK